MSIQQNSKFSSEQYTTILDFLEDPQNKANVFGVSGKTEVGVAPPRKIEAWKELVSLINSKYKGNANEVTLTPTSEHKQDTRGPEPEEDISSPTKVNASPMAAAAHSKRPAVLDNNDAKKARRDRRKERPSIAGTKNPTQARNHLAQTIQDCASDKAAALVTIEEKRLKFEQMKWEIEREEREVKCREEQERRQEDKEDEKVRRDEEKAEKCRERRFALVQTMVADGKSPSEIKEVLAMIL